MSKIDTLVAAIDNAIKTNGTKAITGAILQTVLDNMVGTLTQINGLLNVNQVNNRSDAYASAATARGAVPSDLRAEGLVIAYKLSSGWIIEQNKDISGTWTADSSWQTAGPVSVSQNTLSIGSEYSGEMGDVYDVTLHNSSATFASLEALLSDANLNTLIPLVVRKGGMKIKFVQTSDNKYVQYRLMATSFSTSEDDWQGVDDEPTAGSENLVKSNGIAEQTNTKTLLQGTEIGHVLIDTSGKIVSATDYRLNYVACEAGKTYLITIVGKNSTPAGAAFYSTLPSVGSVGEPILMIYTGSDYQEKQISYTANSDGYIAASSYATRPRTVELLTPLKDVVLQNKESISNINGTLQFDNTPTPNSTKLVNSGSIFEQTRKIYADNTLLQTTELAHCLLDDTGTIIAQQDWRILYAACEADKYYSIYLEGKTNAEARLCFFENVPVVGGSGTLLMKVKGANYNTQNYLFRAPSNGYIVMSTYAVHTKEAYTTVVLQDIQTLLKSSGYINTNALSEKCVTKDKISQELQETLLLAIRSYYVTPYNEFKRKIDALQGNIVSNILFMTDLHYNALPEHYYAIFNGIDNITNVLALCSKEMNINLFCLGGDYPQLPNTATKQDGIDNIYWLNKRLSEYDCPCVMMTGNHEYNYAGTGEGAGLTWNEIYNFVNKKSIVNNKMMVSDTDNQVQCLDDSSVNIRYIFINEENPSDVSDEKHKTAVLSMCQSKPQGYDVIIFCHFVGTNTTLYDSVKSMIDYLDTNNQRIIAWVGGHNHSDSQWVYNNTLCISCLQSGFYTSVQSMDGITYEHTAGTITESAATMLVIDKTLGKIYAIRLGLGVDREFNYNTTSGDIGLVTD